MFDLSAHLMVAVIGERGLTLDTIVKNVKEIGFEDPAEDRRGFLNTDVV
jgi:hypothetical protein